MNAVGKDDKLDMALKGAYTANKYSVTATLAQSGKVRQTCAAASVLLQHSGLCRDMCSTREP